MKIYEYMGGRRQFADGKVPEGAVEVQAEVAPANKAAVHVKAKRGSAAKPR